jgi:hypothetical protein
VLQAVVTGAGAAGVRGARADAAGAGADAAGG